jgi:2-aminoadipate transaminase
MMFKLSDNFSNMKPSATREILKVTSQPGMIAFAGGSPDTSAFPCEEVKKISSQILSDNPVSALVYGVSEGYEPLRVNVENWLKKNDNIGTENDSIIITSGGTQVMDLATRVLTSPGDTIICEEPSFIGSLNCFRSNGCKLVGVEIDADVMNIEKIRKAV